MQHQQRKAAIRAKRDSVGGGAFEAMCTRGSGGAGMTAASAGGAPAAASATSANEAAVVKCEGSDGEPSVDEQRQQTFEANAKLCRLVRRFPCLYNRGHANYAKKNILDKSWLKIAKECNETVPSCKERWRNIRAAYARSVNIYKTNGGPNRVKPYYLHKELNFLLKPMLENRTKLQNKGASSKLPEVKLDESASVEPANEDNKQQLKQADTVRQEVCAELHAPNTSHQQAGQKKTDVNGNHTTSSSESNKEMTVDLPELPYKYLENASPRLDLSLAESNAISPTPTPAPTLTSTSTYAAEPLLCVKRRRLSTDQQQQQRYHNHSDQHNEFMCDRTSGGVQQLNDQSYRVANGVDPDVKFFEALLPDFRMMNPRQKIIFKQKIYQAVQEVLENNEDFPTSSSKHMSNCFAASSTMCDVVNSYDANVPLPAALQPMTVILPQGNAPAIAMEPLQPILIKNEPDDVDIP